MTDEVFGEASRGQDARPQGQSGVAATPSGAWPTKGVDTLRGTGIGYFYDPDDWECTFEASQLDLLDDMMRDRDGYAPTPYRISTLLPGPEIVAVRIPITWDEDGDAEDYEVRLFATMEDAKAAIKAAVPPQDLAREGGSSAAEPQQNIPEAKP